MNWYFTEKVGWPDYALTLEAEDSLVTVTRETGSTMILDFDQDLIDFFDYDVFIQAPARNFCGTW